MQTKMTPFLLLDDVKYHLFHTVIEKDMYIVWQPMKIHEWWEGNQYLIQTDNEKANKQTE